MVSGFTLCAAILVYCSVTEDWTRFCYVIGIQNIRNPPSTRRRIRCGIVPTLESGFRNANATYEAKVRLRSVTMVL